MSFLTLMLLVERVGLPEPHQTAEEQQRPEDLHKETHLEEEEFSSAPTLLPAHQADGRLLVTLLLGAPASIPSVSDAESSSSTATGGFGSRSSWLRGFTPGGGHGTVTKPAGKDGDLWSTRGTDRLVFAPNRSCDD